MAQTVRPQKINASKAQLAAIRIVLVADDGLLRAGIKSLISANGDMVVVGEARDKAQATELIKSNRPGVILLDLELTSEPALEMIPDLLASCKDSRLAALTFSVDSEIHRQALAEGATGIISKADATDSLLNGIKRVHSGGVWLDRFVAARVIRDLSSGNHSQVQNTEERNIETLTKREREVIKLAGRGLSNKQIGDRLFISPVTVHHHLTTVYSKLDVKDRLELILYAYKHHLADIPH